MSEPRLKQFFLPLVRRAFCELGLGEHTIIEYVSDVLSTFARTDHLYRLRSLEGKTMDTVVEMLADLIRPPTEQPHIVREREVRKYVGDYALFMSGMFRGYVTRGGYLNYYLEEGRRSYWKVSQCDLALYRTGFFLFQELSKNFEFYAGGLDYLRNAYFAAAPDEDPFAAFLRQTKGWTGLAFSRN